MGEEEEDLFMGSKIILLRKRITGKQSHESIIYAVAEMSYKTKTREEATGETEEFVCYLIA